MSRKKNKHWKKKEDKAVAKASADALAIGDSGAYSDTDTKALAINLGKYEAAYSSSDSIAVA